MLDFDEVETDNSHTIGVFRTKTGGTSKEPKSVLRTTQSWIKSFEVINSLQKEKENYLIFGDLTHSLALYGMVEALYLGHNVHHVQKLRSKSEVKALVKFEPTFVYITPTQIRFVSSFLINLPVLYMCSLGEGASILKLEKWQNKFFPMLY